MSGDSWKVAVYKRLPKRLQVVAARYSTPNFSVGAIGLITHDGSSLLLVRPTYRTGWMPPGGFLNRGETPVQALQREIAEELGVTMTFLPAHRVAFDVRRQGVTFISVGIAASDADFSIRTNELEDVGWFPLDELPALPNDFTEGLPPADLQAVREAGGGHPLTKH